MKIWKTNLPGLDLRACKLAGLTEIVELHTRVIANLRLSLAVFLNGDLKSAQELLAQKVIFRDLERAYANTHLERLAGQTVQSIETSSLHLDLIADPGVVGRMARFLTGPLS